MALQAAQGCIQTWVGAKLSWSRIGGTCTAHLSAALLLDALSSCPARRARDRCAWNCDVAGLVWARLCRLVVLSWDEGRAGGAARASCTGPDEEDCAAKGAAREERGVLA